MNRKPLAILITAIMVVILCGMEARSHGTAEAQTLAVYSAGINELISKNESKATLSNSRSEKIRKAAEIAKLKADYLNSYKELITKEMTRQNLKPKLYKISYFINEIFYAVIKSPDMTMIEGYSRPESSWGKDGGRRIAQYYRRIEHLINRCNRQSSMSQSKFNAVKKAGKMAGLKADFLKNNRGLLVIGMMENGIDLKDYKIDYFINGEFFNTIRSK